VAELYKRVRTRYRNDCENAAARQKDWDSKYAAQQAIHDVWLRKKRLEDAAKEVQDARARWAEMQPLLDKWKTTLAPEAFVWSPPLQGKGYQDLREQRDELLARMQAGVVDDAREAWQACVARATVQCEVSDRRQERIQAHLKELDLVKRAVEEEDKTASKEHDRMAALYETLDKEPGAADGGVGAIQAEMGIRCGTLGALQGEVPARVAQVQEFFEGERAYRAVVETFLTGARGQLHNLDEDKEEDDVVFGQEKTLAERNREGFANAIVLSSDDEDDPPAKKLKTEPVVVLDS
jgi:hypothetical protein